MSRYTLTELTIANDISAGTVDTEENLTLLTGEGSKLNGTDEEDAGFSGILWNVNRGRPDLDPTAEEVIVVDIPGTDQVRVLRGQGGTSASSHANPRLSIGLTARELDDHFMVSVKDYGALADGTTDDLTACQRAADAAEVLGKTLFFPAGTYLLNGDLDVGCSVRGAGIGRSILKSGASTTNGVIDLDGTDGLTVSDLSFDIDHAVAAVHGEATASGVTERTVIERLYIDASNAGSQGINLQAPSSSQWRYTTIRDVHAINSVTTPTYNVAGILVSAGTTAGGGAHGLLIDNCVVIGFGINLNISAASAGHWEGVKVTNCRLEYSYSYNCRAYHVGGGYFAGNHLDGKKNNAGTARGECGLWADNGSTHRRWKIIGNEFRNHTELALQTEEWANGTIQGNVFEGNERDIHFSGCHNSSIIGNSMKGSTTSQWSVCTDRDFSVTGASTQQYLNNHPAANYSCLISGNTIQNAGEDGLIIAGDDGTLVIGNTIVRSGISSGAAASASGFADILIQRSDDGDAGGSNNQGLRIIGNILGNATQGGSQTAGKSQYGIYQLQGCGFLEIIANEFYDLEDAVEAYGCGSGPVSVINNFFHSCEDMNLATGTGTAIYRGNRFNTGTLASDATYAKDWSGAFEMQGTQRMYIGVPESAPADGDLENGQMVIWGDTATPELEIKWKDAGGTVRNGTITVS